MYAEVLGERRRSRAGICNERPRGKAPRRGVMGLSFMALSSFDFRFSGSRNLGDGDNVGGPPSDRERAFEWDRGPFFRSGVLASPGLASDSAAAGRRIDSCSWLLNIVGRYVVMVDFWRSGP